MKKRKLRVLLVNSPYRLLSKGISGSEWVTPPLGLAYLAAMIPEHEVKIVDMELEKRGVMEIVKEFNPDMVGITATTPTVNNGYRILRLVKGFRKEIVTLIGGCHVSVLPFEAISLPQVDIVVKGEGELTFRELIDNLSQDKPIKKILGTVQKKGKKIIANPDRPFIKEIDELPYPRRELLDYTTYSRPFTKGKKPVTIITSRGCPFNCIYCNKSIFGSCFRPRKVEAILDEIEMLKKQGYDDFHILDDTFSTIRERAKEFCRGIIKRRLKIYWNLANGIRIDSLDEELAVLMKKSGCYCIGFGIESGNQKTQDYIRKNLKVRDIERGFKLVKKVGIESVAFVIIGFPNETREDIRNTVRFLKKVMPDAVNFHVLIPLPGTRVYEELKQKGLLLETDWSKYSFHNPPVYRTENLSREEILQEYRRAYRSYHLSLRYILFRLWKMRDFNQLKSNIKGLFTILRV